MTINTLYNVGDTVWVPKDANIIDCVVDRIEIVVTELYNAPVVTTTYYVKKSPYGVMRYPENEVFASLDAAKNYFANL